MPEFVDTSPAGTCIFCKLVAGQIPSQRVHEDALTLAFMDLGQVNPGHVLVATRRHAATLLDITPEEAAAVMQTTRRVARAAQAAFAPEGLTVLQASTDVAGIEVGHFTDTRRPTGCTVVWPAVAPWGRGRARRRAPARAKPTCCPR
jgi:histidine triad (HIT) family protein